MKIIIWLVPILLLGKVPAAEEEPPQHKTPQKTSGLKPQPIARPTPVSKRKAIPLPPAIQPRPRLARWEYCILDVRVRESHSGPFQLHMPNRSSGRSRDLGKVFREVHIQLVKASRIDEINALNTLGALGWELVSSQKKDDPVGHQIFYYLKRRI